MIEATNEEIRAYCLSMVHEIVIVEERRTQSIWPAWVDPKEVATRIVNGLQCTEQAAQSYINNLALDHLIVMRSTDKRIQPAIKRGAV